LDHFRRALHDALRVLTYPRAAIFCADVSMAVIENRNRNNARICRTQFVKDRSGFDERRVSKARHV